MIKATNPGMDSHAPAMAPLHIETPVLRAPRLDQRLGRELHFKMECSQPSGSFKLRGVGALMLDCVARGIENFVCSSGGNAGLAVAYGAAKLGVKATIVVPSTTSAAICGLLQGYGAQVRVHGAVWDEADAMARALCDDDNAYYVSPFNDPLLWKGHSTLVAEAARQMRKPEAVVVTVGGGGLLCGVLQGMHGQDWKDVPVIAVETHGTASYAAAIAAGRPVSIAKIQGLAKCLGALKVADEAYAWSTRHDIRSTLVSDADAIAACFNYLDELRVLVEPACGAGLAAVVTDAASLKGLKRILVIACGGAAVDSTMLAEWRALMAANA
jgi:L-serine/L-threonine ammonia-lyase